MRKATTSFILLLFTSLVFAGPTDILVKGKIFEGNEVLRGVAVSVNMAHTQYKNYKSSTWSLIVDEQRIKPFLFLPPLT